MASKYFGSAFAPALVSRLGYQDPDPRKIVIIACAFEIYHALKVGSRSMVDECVNNSRFSEIVRNASRIASEYRTKHAEMSESAETSSYRDDMRNLHAHVSPAEHSPSSAVVLRSCAFASAPTIDTSNFTVSPEMPPLHVVHMQHTCSGVGALRILPRRVRETDTRNHDVHGDEAAGQVASLL